MLLSLAVDYRHADVATRERFHLTPERLAHLYVRAAAAPAPAGGPPHGLAPVAVAPTERVALATCNRSEAYAWAPAAAAGGRALEAQYVALARAWMGGETGARQLLAAARRRAGDAAARHLLRVAAGLESQVLGDSQLLGQLRAAHAAAGAAGATGTVLGRLFESALHVGKRVRAETTLSSGRHSVGAEAANVAMRRFGSLAHARVVVVGCGTTGERVARQLAKLGARDLVLLNRSPERAERLAAAVGGRAAPLGALYGELALADVAVVAASSTEPVVYADPLVSARRRCATAQYPLLLIDLGVPRNVDPALGSVAAVTIVDLDALRPVVAAGERERGASVPEAERIVEEERAALAAWVRDAAAREAVRPFCTALAAVCRREVAYAVGMAGADAATRDAVAERAAGRVVAKLLAGPMQTLRAAAADGESCDALVAALARLFPAEAPNVAGTRSLRPRRRRASEARAGAAQLAGVGADAPATAHAPHGTDRRLRCI
ncbi:glutamyl-tRNA reductase [Gemmatimonadetes bacterium T265]|nr:glutamyl-tRNA reductase [Gemmatimonadetes bacterium T265]